MKPSPRRRVAAPPAAGPADLAKWSRLVEAALAAVAAPAETKALVKARNATRKGCAMPAGQFWVGSPFHRFSSATVVWTSLTVAGRIDASAQFKAQAEACREILKTLTEARGRADLEN